MCVATASPKGGLDVSPRGAGFVRVLDERSELPSSGQILRSLQGSAFDAERYDRERAARYARGEGLY